MEQGLPKVVIVTSDNPVKGEAIQAAFAAMFPDEPFTFKTQPADSGVGPQPMTSVETLQGARNRIADARAKHLAATCYASIEGGVEDFAEGMGVFAWVVIQDERREGKACTAVFFPPDEVATLVRQGMELGDADDLVFQQHNSKQNTGSVGLLTDDVVTRTSYYTQAAILALIPFKHPQMNFTTNEAR